METRPNYQLISNTTDRILRFVLIIITFSIVSTSLAVWMFTASAIKRQNIVVKHQIELLDAQKDQLGKDITVRQIYKTEK